MSQNALLGLLFVLVGVADIAIARWLGARVDMNTTVRGLLTALGLGFLALGTLIALGVIRVL